MKKIFAFLVLFSMNVFSEHDYTEDTNNHSHEGHLHETLVDGKDLEVNSERFDKFVEKLIDVQIAVVSVKGMVCDFCARGIEKTFKKDKSVKKIDVDLSKGQVLIAYPLEADVNFDDIKQKILVNGLNAIDMKIINI